MIFWLKVFCVKQPRSVLLGLDTLAGEEQSGAGGGGGRWLATGYLEFSLRRQPGAPLGRLPPGQGPLPPPACGPQGSSPPSAGH